MRHNIKCGPLIFFKEPDLLGNIAGYATYCEEVNDSFAPKVEPVQSRIIPILQRIQ